jgi:23S rRNA (uracil1939-C5)-methyltransferase
MDPLMNEIRLAFFETAIEQGLTFYDVRQRTGYLRNLMVRNTTQGEWMVLLSVSEDNPETLKTLMDRVQERVPTVQNLLYTINTKANDSLEGLEIRVFSGQNRVVQVWDGLSFGISASSFFQTNPQQAEAMLGLVREWCGLSGQELVYDLYTGTGSIALFLAKQASRVVGIEYVQAAVDDACRNAEQNDIHNTEFFAGDMAALLNNDFFEAHGYPDVVVVDPPRAGMHPDVVEALKNCGAQRLVYVSCNASTQARDLQALSDTYRLLRYRPVDLFPQTAHIENLALLERIHP